MEKISQGQLICIKTVIGKLKKAGAPEMKDVDAVVLGFSGYRTEHVSELWMPEATALIKHLKSLDPDEVAADKMRKKLYAIGYGYHGLGKNASPGEKLESRKRTEAWVLQYGGNKKKLDNYTVKGLATLVSVYEKVNVEMLVKL